MVAGHLRKHNGIYQMNYVTRTQINKRCSKSISTGLPIKGNKTKAEALLEQTRKEFIPPIWNKDTYVHIYISQWLKFAPLEAIDFPSTSCTLLSGSYRILKSRSSLLSNFPYRIWNNTFYFSEKQIIRKWQVPGSLFLAATIFY